MSNEQEIYEIIKKRYYSNREITNKTYSKKVWTLVKSKLDLNNFEVVKTYILKNYTQKTYKSMLTSVVVFLKSNDSSEDLIKLYSDEVKRVNLVIENGEKDNVKNKKEDENMISRNQIKDVIENLKKKINSEPVLEDYQYFDNFKKYLVVNLYYLIQPIRNDYIGCEVHTKEVFFQNKEKNYIFLESSKLVLNRYKTSKTYGTGNVIDLPLELVDIVKRWMEIRVIIYPKLNGNVELLLTKNLEPMGQVNLTQFLNRIFQKNVSSTILRKSFISEKYPVIHTVNEMQSDARAMQHSVAIQQSSYRKKQT